MHILSALWTGEAGEPEVRNSYQYVFELRDRLDETLKLATQELERAQGKYKHHYDKNAKARSFKTGDKVLILLPTDNNKLLMQWKGPHEVVGIVSKNDYRVKVMGKEKTYHANLLKLYIEREGLGKDQGKETKQHTVSATVVEYENEADCSGSSEDLITLEGITPKESIKDAVVGPDLPGVLSLLTKYKGIFTDVPG